MADVSRPAYMVERQSMLDGLARIGVRLCGYARPDGAWGRCDCKYGASGRGEQTGCPEVRALWAVVDAMTDGEWTVWVGRAEAIEVMEREMADEKPHAPEHGTGDYEPMGEAE